MYTIDVVNRMLGTLGEKPLATLTEPHTFRGACVSILNTTDEAEQARGWWYNRETLTLQPSATDGTVYLPGDALAVRTPRGKPWVERGGRLYDTVLGDWVRVEAEVSLVRRVAFDDLPALARAHIGSAALLRFQTSYDGDSTKTRQLAAEAANAEALAKAEETRQVKANRIEANGPLMRIKASIYTAARRG